MKLLLFLILLIVCWPAALLALLLYPFVRLVLFPFRLLGLVVIGTFELVGAIFRFRYGAWISLGRFRKASPQLHPVFL